MYEPTGDSERRIREIAHRLWEEEGYPVGQQERHWEQAKKIYGEEADRPRADSISAAIDSLTVSSSPGADAPVPSFTGDDLSAADAKPAGRTAAAKTAASTTKQGQRRKG